MRRRMPVPWWAELPLVAVSVATVAGFIRVYDGWSFLVPLLAFSLGAHVLAIASRRLRAPSIVVVLLAAVGAAVAVGLILFPDTTFAGVPTAATWDAASASLRFARDRYPVVIAPTEVLPGFQLAAGVALWIAAWFGDWAAHRIRATAEAVAATTAIFVFCSVLGSGRDEVACAAAFAATVLVFVGVQRSLAIEREQSWLPTNRTTARAVLRSAGPVAAIALVAGILVGPSLPGASSEAAVEWRGGKADDTSRVTISPMVEIKKRLVQQSNREVFRVRSSEPAYWRLTSLDSFDGEIWSSSGEFERADGQLPSEAPAAGDAANTITQEITIEGLEAIWAPTAFEAVDVTETETPLRWDPDSSTLIVDSSQPTSDGLSYSVVSRSPTFDSADLEGADEVDPDEISARYLNLPSDFPFLAANLAREVTAGASNRYEQALALQDWFRREFDYSLEPDAGHGDDDLVAFLQSGEGYCEQFAGTFAAMARSLDIPARVAVGFTPGNTNPDDPDLYRVYGRHAHAWPEVYFPETGWVAFEPTPSRGIPGAEDYTGVRAQQELAQPVVVTSSTTAPATTTAAPPTEGRPDVTRPPVSERADTGAPQPSATGGGGSSGWILAVAALATVAVLSVMRFRRRRIAQRHLQGLSHPDQVWATIVSTLASRRGMTIHPAATHTEVAEQAADAVGADAEALARIAELVATARWSPDALSPADTVTLDQLADQVLTGLRATPKATERTPAPA